MKFRREFVVVMATCRDTSERLSNWHLRAFAVDSSRVAKSILATSFVPSLIELARNVLS
jgi:hypothetical protein